MRTQMAVLPAVRYFDLILSIALICFIHLNYIVPILMMSLFQVLSLPSSPLLKVHNSAELYREKCVVFWIARLNCAIDQMVTLRCCFNS